MFVFFLFLFSLFFFFFLEHFKNFPPPEWSFRHNCKHEDLCIPLGCSGGIYPVRYIFLSAPLGVDSSWPQPLAIQLHDSFSSRVSVSQESRLCPVWLVLQTLLTSRRLSSFHIDLHSGHVLFSIRRWSKYIHTGCLCVCVRGCVRVCVSRGEKGVAARKGLMYWKRFRIVIGTADRVCVQAEENWIFSIVV